VPEILLGAALYLFPVHIFSEIQWQGDPTIAAASSMQIVIIGLLILVVQRTFRLRLVV
jgi:ABC-type spermidine/putrescine transport system permease subunit II